MKARTFILTALLTAIVTPSFAQSFRETNPLSDSGVRTLASWAESQIDENGRLRDYTPTDEPLYTGAVSDGQSSSVQESLQKIADMMPCEEGKEWKLQQANLDDDAMAAAQMIKVKKIGKEDREPLNRDYHSQFAGVGKVICNDPVAGEFWSTVTLVGDQKTVIGSGHYRMQGKSEAFPQGYIYKAADCRFELFDYDGNTVFRSSLKVDEEKLSLSEAAFRKNTQGLPDWSVMTLEKAVPANIAKPIKIANTLPGELNNSKGVFMVAYHGNSSVIPPKMKVYGPECLPKIIPNSGGNFMHTCDTNSGSSGGLLFKMTKSGEIYAVGMNTRHGGSAIDANIGQAFYKDMLDRIPGQKTQFAALFDNTADL